VCGHYGVECVIVSGKIAGDTVLTLGTGGVSIFAVQFAKMFGARDRDLCSTKRSNGFENFVSIKPSIIVRDDWDAAVLDLTDKRGVDHREVGGSGTLAKRSTRFVSAVTSRSGIGCRRFQPGPALYESVRFRVFRFKVNIEDMKCAVSVNN
jgi:NADPH:quinone reductase-like Zn-dependent oxidoreductase